MPALLAALTHNRCSCLFLVMANEIARCMQVRLALTGNPGCAPDLPALSPQSHPFFHHQNLTKDAKRLPHSSLRKGMRVCRCTACSFAHTCGSRADTCQQAKRTLEAKQHGRTSD